MEHQPNFKPETVKKVLAYLEEAYVQERFDMNAMASRHGINASIGVILTELGVIKKIEPKCYEWKGPTATESLAVEVVEAMNARARKQAAERKARKTGETVVDIAPIKTPNKQEAFEELKKLAEAAATLAEVAVLLKKESVKDFVLTGLLAR